MPLRKKEINKESEYSLFFGIVSLILNAYGVVGLLSVIYGILGLNSIKNKKEKGKKIAITGIILGSIGILFGIYKIIK